MIPQEYINKTEENFRRASNNARIIPADLSKLFPTFYTEWEFPWYQDDEKLDDPWVLKSLVLGANRLGLRCRGMKVYRTKILRGSSWRSFYIGPLILYFGHEKDAKKNGDQVKPGIKFYLTIGAIK